MSLTAELNKQAIETADRLGGLEKSSQSPYHNDQYDAFRHAYTSALVTEKVGPELAKWLGDKNEGPYEPNGKHKGMSEEQYKGEKNMDQWNNNVGRQEYEKWKKAKDASQTTLPLDKWIYDRVKEKATINDPGDSRRWVEPESGSDLARSANNDPERNWVRLIGENYTDALRTQLRRLIDPIVIDLDGNGIELTGRANSSVFFDMDADGIKEQTGWVSPTDGLLTIDSNANGKVDTINELIGDLGRSGFTELLTYDSNNDRVINASDTIWSQFRVWIDTNSNGSTDAGELRTLSSLNIRSIDLNYTNVSFSAEGNRIHEQSIFEYTNGRTGLIADIWFDVSNVATDAAITRTGNNTIDLLPNIHGRGNVKSLRSAMLTDGALTSLVVGFVGQQLNNLGNARSQTEQIIYRWTGVQSVQPDSRGIFFDGRKLAALEAFLGTEFIVEGVRDPNEQAASNLTAAWNRLVNGVLSRLLLSGPLAIPMAESAVYIPEADRLLTFQTPAQLLESFASVAPFADGLVVAGFWAAVLPLAQSVIQESGGDSTSANFNEAVIKVLQPTGLAAFAHLLEGGIQPVTTFSSVLHREGMFRLTAEDDTLYLGPDRHVVFAGAGNDVVAVTIANAQGQHLNGGEGNDQLYGTPGDDWIDGGTGADTMVGSGGDDTYSVDQAGDVVSESPGDGTDHVRASMSYTLGDNLEQLTLLGTTAINGIGNGLDNQITGNGAANRLDGLAGNDTLDGGAGNDTMLGGRGMDYYRVDAPGDLIIESGDDRDTVEASLNHILAARLEELIMTGQALSGTGNEADNTLWGNGLDNTLDGRGGTDTMRGGKGNDTYIVDRSFDQIIEEEECGTDRVWSTVTYQLGEHIEHLFLDGWLDISGTGNNLDNQLSGNSNNNRLDGQSGADTMSGGNGNDIYIVDSLSDVIIESSNSGIDQVLTELTNYTLPRNIDYLQLFINSDEQINRDGTGNELDNVLIGTSGINRLIGLDGNDTLFGYSGTDSLTGGSGNDLLDGGSERDRLEGGAGNDRYIVDQATDVVIEALNAGIDTVESSVSWILGANLENLVISGRFGEAIDGQGNALNNRLTGSDADNKLDGGAGADTMAGWRGNDIYSVDNTRDVVQEATDGGEDHVRSSISYNLGMSLEHLTLLGTASLNGLGNALANRLTGNSASNRLEGLSENDTLDGGAGSDTLLGGLGADLYRVDSAGDVIHETGSDIDTVEASLNYTLGSRLENLVLAGTALNGTGNELKNVLTGNALNNILNGGADTDEMIGGPGNDTYIIDNSGDSAQEDAEAGLDRVLSNVNHTLSTNIEELVLTGSQDIKGTGNDLSNQIIGNPGDNRIAGEKGADTMEGGDGDDTYIVEDAGDMVVETTNGGDDWVESLLSSYTLAANIENLQLFVDWDNTSNRDGSGNGLNNQLVGTGGSNRLSGLSGNDTLFGLSGIDSLYGGDGADLLDGGADRDRMEGGAGDDTYMVSDRTDEVIEAVNAGIDTILSDISWTLANNLENLTFTAWYKDNSGKGNGLNNKIIGNSGNDNLDGGAGTDTLIGGKGFDTYTVDNAGDVVIEAAEPDADLVQSTISYTLGSNLERLTLLGTGAINGTGNEAANLIVGNSAANRLEGLAENDTLEGGAGVDTLVGGMGADVYIVDSSADVILETGADRDTVISATNYTLPALLEELELIGSAQKATGNVADNTLRGNQLNNTIDGASGGDTLIGGLGDDTYIVDDFGDIVQEENDGGRDHVQSFITFNLGSNVEDLSLIGSLDIIGSGNSLNNQITGNSGDNQLSGGSGADTMSGGSGDDIYTIEDSSDLVIEAANEGVDWITSLLDSYALPDNVEHLDIVDWSDGVNRSGTGNSLHNQLIGSDGINRLNGLEGNDTLEGLGGNDSLYGGNGNDLLDGGSDQDRLEGGAGDDRYSVDRTTDQIIEAANAGIDTVESPISWILGANLEHLTLTGGDACDGQGNSFNNRLTGNRANNILDGGLGADTMAGGDGDDTYVIDNSGDVVRENPGGGNDRIRSSISCTLLPFLEHLSLLGSGPLTASGNTLANMITGNAGNNSITGGLGQDTLTGNAGADTFIFQRLEDSGSLQATADLISDFSSSQGDRINLSGLDANPSTLADNAFTYIDTAIFTAAGQARRLINNSITYIELNTNADLSTVEMTIALTGVLNLTASNFVL